MPHDLSLTLFRVEQKFTQKWSNWFKDSGSGSDHLTTAPNPELWTTRVDNTTLVPAHVDPTPIIPAYGVVSAMPAYDWGVLPHWNPALRPVGEVSAVPASVAAEIVATEVFRLKAELLRLQEQVESQRHSPAAPVEQAVPVLPKKWFRRIRMPNDVEKQI